MTPDPPPADAGLCDCPCHAPGSSLLHVDACCHGHCPGCGRAVASPAAHARHCAPLRALHAGPYDRTSGLKRKAWEARRVSLLPWFRAAGLEPE